MHVLRAEALDNDGNSTLSRPVEIKVLPQPDISVVTIIATDKEAREKSPFTDELEDLAVFEVRRTGNAEKPLTVFYGIKGSAENGTDYKELDGIVEFAEGESAVEIVVQPLDDDVYEGDETVVAFLHTPITALAGALIPHWYRVGEPSHARVVIHDNDPAPPNQPPFVKLVAPLDGTSFRAGETIRLSASARDADGSVQQVEFFANDESIGFGEYSLNSDALHPFYSLKWEAVPAGCSRRRV